MPGGKFLSYGCKFCLQCTTPYKSISVGKLFSLILYPDSLTSSVSFTVKLSTINVSSHKTPYNSPRNGDFRSLRRCKKKALQIYLSPIALKFSIEGVNERLTFNTVSKIFNFELILTRDCRFYNCERKTLNYHYVKIFLSKNVGNKLSRCWQQQNVDFGGCGKKRVYKFLSNYAFIGISEIICKYVKNL